MGEPGAPPGGAGAWGDAAAGADTAAAAAPPQAAPPPAAAPPAAPPAWQVQLPAWMDGASGGTLSPMEAPVGGMWPSAAPAAPAPPPPADGTRCLDRTHASSCDSCSLPPPEAEYEWFELVGESGKKNGEKKLRSLLSTTHEWNNATERARTADLAEAGGMAELAAALRSKRCAALRKRHFLFLCSTWRYRSDVWARKGGAKRRVGGGEASGEGAEPAPVRQSQRRRVTRPVMADEDDEDDEDAEEEAEVKARARQPPPPPPFFAFMAPPQLAPAPAVTHVQPETAWQLVASQLRPLSLEAAQQLWGDAARAAAATLGADHITREAVDGVAALRREACDGALYAGTLQAACVHTHMQLAATQGFVAAAPTPALAPSDVEVLLSTRMLPYIHRAMALHATHAASSGTPHAVAVWLTEMHRAAALLGAALEHATAILRASRGAGASRSSALKVECIILEWLAACACSAHAALLRREAWMGGLIAQRAAAAPATDAAPAAAVVRLPLLELPRDCELVPLAVRAHWRPGASAAAPVPHAVAGDAEAAAAFLADTLGTDTLFPEAY